MKTIKHFSTFIATVVFLLSGFVLEAQQLEVSPTQMAFSANTGSSQTLQLYVRNKAQTEQSFIFTISDWLMDNEGKTTYFDAGTTGRSCAEWITVSPSLVTLQPNESANVNVTMLVPNDDASTKWAVVFVESAVERTGATAVDKQVSMGMRISARIAVTIFQSPKSNTFYKGTLEGLSEKVDAENNRTYETTVINLGDKILNCKVYFTVSNLATAEEFTSEPIEFPLLPENNKKIEYTLDEKLPKGKYSVAAILDYGNTDELEGIQLDVDVK
ncbi:MAG: hypothetical protein DRI89_02900 [Bacteroidetes bacterium]|nr:MAG: hypothetical protein DRI89_02900 [Bacteroidota bacterium]